ncbi:3-hydroxybutyryl-CoA dehydrogenase [Bifidobacterium callitrichos]|uniref:L-gulonate 3-dehydrogenase n=2 Tax=Bifidobacterium callitrichos TaxID=762209 RepID=A0A2T3G966_9BIFI|nr:3-hydroxybutyryl-CoA dehydrogenase [Bifidobacterium callitrichos]
MKSTESTEPTAADTAPANGGTAVNLEDITTIASIGTGTMGHAIALQFALAGYPTRLIGRSESSLNRAMTNIRTDATTLANAGLLWNDESVDDVLARIMPVIGYERGISGADFVIEAIDENLDVKREAWQEIERFAHKGAIFATNTSGLSPTAIAEALERPERFVVAHFWNPAHLMPLVEVVPGERTDPQTLGTTVELMKRIGKKPAQLNREALGFIGNRLQMALLREEFHIIQEGIADAATVDDVMKYSLGRRWNLVGPVASIDLGGLDVFYNISTYLFDDMDNGTGPSPLLAEKVKAGDLGAKTGRGFFSWQGETGKRIIERRDAALLQALKEDMAEDEDL